MGEVAARESPLLVPAVGVFYAALLAAAAFAIDQLAGQVGGPWFNLLAVAALLAALVTTALLLRTGWRRHREGLEHRAALWGAGALATIVLGIAAVYVLVQTASFASIISGADVHLTRPVLVSLPRPPGATLLEERPGLSGTESVSDDFKTGDLAAVLPFYQAALPGLGWTEDQSSLGGPEVRFSKGAYVVSVALDQATGAGDFAVTVDRLTPDLLSPSGSPAATASP